MKLTLLISISPSACLPVPAARGMRNTPGRLCSGSQPWPLRTDRLFLVLHGPGALHPLRTERNNPVCPMPPQHSACSPLQELCFRPTVLTKIGLSQQDLRSWTAAGEGQRDPITETWEEGLGSVWSQMLM